MNQRSNCQYLLNHKKAREFQKNIYFCFTDFAKVFYCVDHNKLWKILKEMGIPEMGITYHLRNLYAGQEAIVRTRHGTADWFRVGKGVCQGHVLSPVYVTSIQVDQMVKNPPAVQEVWVRLLIGKIPWRKAWQPTSVFLPGESHG